MKNKSAFTGVEIGHYINYLKCNGIFAVFPRGSDLMNTSRISDLSGQEGPKTVFIGPI